MKTVIIYGVDGRQDEMFPVLEEIGFSTIKKIVLVKTASWSTEAIQKTRRELVEVTGKVTGIDTDSEFLSLAGIDINKVVLKGESLMEYLDKQQQLLKSIEGEKAVILMDAGVRTIGSFFLVSLTDALNISDIWHMAEDEDELVKELWPRFPLESMFTGKNDRDLLTLIQERKEMSMKELVKETSLSESTISRRTQRFERLNLVERVRDGRELKVVAKPTADAVLTVTDPSLYSEQSEEMTS